MSYKNYRFHHGILLKERIEKIIALYKGNFDKLVFVLTQAQISGLWDISEERILQRANHFKELLKELPEINEEIKGEIEIYLNSF